MNVIQIDAQRVAATVEGRVREDETENYLQCQQPKLVNVSFKQQLQQFLRAHSNTLTVLCNNLWQVKRGTPKGKLLSDSAQQVFLEGIRASVCW